MDTNKNKAIKLKKFAFSPIYSHYSFMFLVTIITLALYALFFSSYSLYNQKKLQNSISLLEKKIIQKKQALYLLQKNVPPRRNEVSDFLNPNEIVVDIKIPRLKTKIDAQIEIKNPTATTINPLFFITLFFFTVALFFFMKKYKKNAAP